MREVPNLRAYVVLLVLLFAGTLFAQTSHELPSDPNAPVPGGGVESDAGGEQEPSSNATAKPQYVPALDGGGLIPLGRAKKLQWFYGGMFSYGWNSDIGGLHNGDSGTVTAMSPYFGVEAETDKASYLFQYQPTITTSTSNAAPDGVFERIAADVIGQINGRWSWKFNVSATYGQDFQRFLAPLQTTALGDIVATSSNAAAYSAGAGTVTLVQTGANFQFRKSDRDAFNFYLGNSYNHFSGTNQDNNIATLQATYSRQLTPRANLQAYGQSFYEYGTLQCSSVGGGMGVEIQLRQQTTLQIRGGPEVNSGACGKQQGFSFNAAFARKLSGSSQLYLLVNREFGTSYLGPGLWQDNGSVGYQRRLTLLSMINIDSGCVRTNALASAPSYRGVFVGAVYSYQLKKGLISSVSYRFYNGTSGGAGLTQNVVLFSIAWSPTHGRLPN